MNPDVVRIPVYRISPTLCAENPVTLSAEEYAFFGAGDTAAVKAVDCSLTLEDRAFQYCENLSAVTIGSRSVEIGESVFSAALTHCLSRCPVKHMRTFLEKE